MDFSEKFSALLALTATKNIMLARALNIDTAQISRMKTGARKMPTKAHALQSIAEFLAGRFDSEYRLTALYELTNDARLHMTLTDASLAAIIYDWLVSPDPTPKNQFGRFLDRLGDFSMQDMKTVNQPSENTPPALGDNGFVAYYNNEGKRQAVRDFLAYVLTLNEPCTIRVFTDECLDWLLEDNAFNRELTSGISQCVQKGCKFQRIQPPTQTPESNVRSIERWLPAYMAGALRLFYYPWARDELHRRTIIVVPGQIAIHSDSLAEQRECPMTILTTDKMTVRLTDEHYSRILERCRTMMNVFTDDTSVKPSTLYEEISKLHDFGICKSGRLSILTLSPDLLSRIRLRGSLHIQRMFDDYEKNAQFRQEVLKTNVITDIICLPALEDVIQGTAQIPGTKSSPTDVLYYTPDEYRMHIEHILWYLDAYPNYQAVLLDEPLFENVILYVKGNRIALLIKEKDPFVLFEITEQSLVSSLCDYLWRLVKEQSYTDSRHIIVQRLKDELSRLEQAMEI